VSNRDYLEEVIGRQVLEIDYERTGDRKENYFKKKSRLIDIPS
jgi:hypothetical protein